MHVNVVIEKNKCSNSSTRYSSFVILISSQDDECQYYSVQYLYKKVDYLYTYVITYIR